MSYATPQDMIDRFGNVELIRLTTPSDQDMDVVNEDAVQRALDEASAQIDTYLRKRYQVPLDLTTPEIRRACCMMARYDLSMGDNREPSEQVRLAFKQVIDWLQLIAKGDVLLDLTEVASGDDSYAQMADRAPAFGVERPSGFGQNPVTGAPAPQGSWNGRSFLDWP